MILKKENRKNIENWTFGRCSKFEISKFSMIFWIFFFRILNFFFEKILNPGIFWLLLVDTLIWDSLLKISWKNLKKWKFYAQYRKNLHIYQIVGFFEKNYGIWCKIVVLHLIRRRISCWFWNWFHFECTSNGSWTIIQNVYIEPNILKLVAD